MMKKYSFFLVSYIVLLFMFGTMFGVSYLSYNKYRSVSDEENRLHIFKLFREGMSCTGVEIETTLGHRYVLTASHCRDLVVDGTVLAEAEDHSVDVLRFVAEDPNSDLMLLSSAMNQSSGIKIANSIKVHQHVHTLSRGHGKPTYRTDGEIEDVELTKFPLSIIRSEDDMEKCSMPKNIVEKVTLGFFEPVEVLACFMQTDEQISTAPVLPGSSGGALLDESGKLVGIVSAAGDNFYSYVMLKDIHSFLRGR